MHRIGNNLKNNTFIIRNIIDNRRSSDFLTLNVLTYIYCKGDFFDRGESENCDNLNEINS